MSEPTASTDFDGLVLAHDPDDAQLLRADSVMGITQTTRTLIDSTPVRPIESALDLGCGSGLFALLAARRAQRVIATDLNPRACEITAANAATNGFTNVEARVGSLFEPVHGERFDLIASNLPFVVSPDSDYVFRDGGLGGDEISRVAVTAAPDHLSDGGVAVMTACWAVREGQAWQDPVTDWIEPIDCDVLVLGGSTQTPREYAHLWNGPMLMNDPASYAATLNRWLAYYVDQHIVALCYGTIILQRRIGTSPWKRIETQRRGPRPGGGSQVDRALRNGPIIAELDDASIQQLRFAPIPLHRLEQDLEFRSDGYVMQRCTMVLSESCGVVGEIEPLTSAVLFRLDGHTPLGELINAAAADHGQTADDAAPTVRNFRELASSGLLEFTEPTGTR